MDGGLTSSLQTKDANLHSTPGGNDAPVKPETAWNDNPQATILVVDDEEMSRQVASRLLIIQGYQVLTAADGAEALALLERKAVDVILLDVLMPRMDGFEVCRRIKGHRHWQRIPVVMLTALSGVDSRVAALEAGADDFISKPYDQAELLARVKTSVRVKRLNEQLEDTESVLFALANAVEVKAQDTDQHLKRMAHFCERLARLAGLSASDQRIVRYGGILHDIGKVGISDTILLKPGNLTSEEYEIMKQHTILGQQIVQPMRFGRRVGLIVRGHHERWDGHGYPDGLAGEAIPIGARIVAVADIFDAMTSDRPYRRALPDEAAVEELRKYAGTQLDPVLAELFVTHLDEIRGNDGADSKTRGQSATFPVRS